MVSTYRSLFISFGLGLYMLQLHVDFVPDKKLQTFPSYILETSFNFIFFPLNEKSCKSLICLFLYFLFRFVVSGVSSQNIYFIGLHNFVYDGTGFCHKILVQPSKSLNWFSTGEYINILSSNIL